MKTMKLSDIKIKKSFADTTPSEIKMSECRKNWNELHTQDRYIVVNRNNELVDGYIQYLVLKENGIDTAEIKVSNCKRPSWRRINKFVPEYRKRMTTYIYGIHPNSKSTKERVWRVPNSWIGWENGLLPGDQILVETKRGIAPIIITKIKWTDKCPTDLRVRKVYNKFNNKGEE